MTRPSTYSFRILGLAALLSAAATTNAAAQMLPSTDRVFVNGSIGRQTKARTFTISGSQPIYDETATFQSTVGIGNSGLIDVMAGMRVWKNLGFGVGFSLYTDKNDGTLTASIPDPVRFDSPSVASATGSDLKHEERGVHISAVWMVPVTDRIDVALFAGPSFFMVTQDLLSGITVAPGTSALGSVTTSKLDETVTGLHGGFDVRYLVTKYIGAGVFARYASGKKDVTIVDGGKLEVGGLQYGVGLRIRF